MKYIKCNLRFGLKYIPSKIVTLYILDSMLMGLFFCTKKEIIYFEENKFFDAFVECLGFFTSKDPIMLSVVWIK